MVRAPPCHGGSCGFEPRLPRSSTQSLSAFFYSLIILSFLLTSCKASPQEQLRKEGHKITHLLIQDLKRIKNRDDLLLVKADLERHFTLLGEAMLKTRQNAHLPPLEFSQEDHRLSEELSREIQRVNQLEGGRQVLAAAQKSMRAALEKQD